jgi:hypothetical protein
MRNNLLPQIGRNRPFLVHGADDRIVSPETARHAAGHFAHLDAHDRSSPHSASSPHQRELDGWRRSRRASSSADSTRVSIGSPGLDAMTTTNRVHTAPGLAAW